MKFKIDENLPREIAGLLHQAGHDALTVYDQNLVGESDQKIAEICQAENRCILTLDLDFADIRTTPHQNFAGRIVLRLSRTEKPFVLEVLQNLIPRLEEQRLMNTLWIVEEQRIRIRRLQSPNNPEVN